MNFNPFPTLVTERLILRRLQMLDDKEIFFLRSDERVLQYIDIPKAETIEDARKHIDKINNVIDNNESIMWGICLKDSGTVIGTICFWNIIKETRVAETGYMLHPGSQGKGIMQEALNKIIDYGFGEMKLTSIIAGVHPDNAKSIKLLERNDFVYTGQSDDDGMSIYTLPESQ